MAELIDLTQEVPLDSLTGIGHLVNALEKSCVTGDLPDMHDISRNVGKK